MVTHYTVKKPTVVQETLDLSSSPVKLEVEEQEEINTTTYSVSTVPPAQNGKTLSVDESILTELLQAQALEEREV